MRKRGSSVRQWPGCRSCLAAAQCPPSKPFHLGSATTAQSHSTKARMVLHHAGFCLPFQSLSSISEHTRAQVNFFWSRSPWGDLWAPLGHDVPPQGRRLPKGLHSWEGVPLVLSGILKTSSGADDLSAAAVLILWQLGWKGEARGHTRGLLAGDDRGHVRPAGLLAASTQPCREGWQGTLHTLLLAPGAASMAGNLQAHKCIWGIVRSASKLSKGLADVVLLGKGLHPKGSLWPSTQWWGAVPRGLGTMEWVQTYGQSRAEGAVGVSPGGSMKAAAVCGWGGDGKHCGLQQFCASAHSVPFTDSAYIACKKKRKNHAEGKFTLPIKNKPQPPAQLFLGIRSHAAAASRGPAADGWLFFCCFFLGTQSPAAWGEEGSWSGWQQPEMGLWGGGWSYGEHWGRSGAGQWTKSCCICIPTHLITWILH